jgi:23S rRNA (guanosine2251-2'-O)-methyltransferase
MTNTVMRQCVRKACAFRFPGPDGPTFPCPKCGAATSVVALMLEYNQMASEKPHTDPNAVQIEAGLDNLRSALNVGSIFRTSDGAGINHIHLFGICPPPTHPQIKKTALGADQNIPWTQHWDGLAAVRTLKQAGYSIWSLERNHDSLDIFSLPPDGKLNKILLVVGNENTGIDPGILAESDRTIHIPMQGNKESLNVASAYAIAVYWLKFGLFKD